MSQHGHQTSPYDSPSSDAVPRSDDAQGPGHIEESDATRAGASTEPRSPRYLTSAAEMAKSVQSFGSLWLPTKLELLKTGPENMTIGIYARSHGGEHFQSIMGDVPKAVLNAFSGAALAQLEPKTKKRWLLTGVGAEELRTLVNWAMAACRQIRVPAIDTTLLSAYGWMSLWKTAVTLEMPIATDMLNRQLKHDIHSLDLQSSLPCYYYAQQFVLPVPEARFHKHLFDLAAGKVDAPLAPEQVDQILHRCPDRTIVGVAINELANRMYDRKPFSINLAMTQLGNSSYSLRSQLYSKWVGWLQEGRP